MDQITRGIEELNLCNKTARRKNFEMSETTSEMFLFFFYYTIFTIGYVIIIFKNI